MKHSIAALFLLATAALALAEQLEVGGYFSVDIPRSWQVTISGRGINDEGSYVVYGTRAPSCLMSISVRNNDPKAISFENYQRLYVTKEDLAELARYNQTVGWSVPSVRKDVINGIPVLFFREEKNREPVRRLEMDLWIQDRSFTFHFLYYPDAVAQINRIIDSLQPSVPMTGNLTIGDL
jgi:hypothetical protein